MLTISIQPESLRKYLRYDVVSNSILTSNYPLDYEEVNELELSVTVSSEHKDVLQCPGIVHVLDVNDNAPRFLRNYFIGFIIENSLPNTWIVNVEVSDRDSSQFSVTFSLSGEGHEHFNINRNNGTVSSASKFDREQRDRYNLKVRVSDGVHALETGMQITVVDMNDNAPQISNEAYNSTIVINKSQISMRNFTVINIHATDNDDPLSNNSQVFCGMSTLANSVITRKILFLNRSSCQLTISPKYKHLISSNLTLTVSIMVSDRGDPPLGNITVLRIHFVDEAYEIRISNRTFKHPITVLHTTPRDAYLITVEILNKNQFENILFDAPHGNGTSILRIHSETGKISTKTSMRLSKVGSWYSLHVRVLGRNKGSIIRQSSNLVQIDFIISDFNLYSPEIRIEPNIVTFPENIEIGRRLTKVRIVDKDEGISGMLEVKTDESSREYFSLLPSVERNVFYLTTIANIDYERKPRHDVIVIVRDLGSPSRSQAATFVLIVTDVDDNAPYFSENYVTIKLSSPQTTFQLPAAHDDDVTTTNNRYSVSPGGLIELRPSDDHLVANLNKRYWNMSRLHFTVSIMSSALQNNCVSCSKLIVYLIIDIANSGEINCPLARRRKNNVVNDLQYNILSVDPRSSLNYVNIHPITGEITQTFDATLRQIIFAISASTNRKITYKICREYGQGHDEPGKSFYLLRLPKIVIKTDIKKGTSVGKIEILQNGVNVSRKFYFHFNCEFFLPFLCLNRGETIIASWDIFTRYPSVYNVTVRARYKNDTALGIALEESMLIVVGSESVPVTNIDMTIRVREMEGNGIIMGRVPKLLRKAEVENLVLDGSSAVVLDKKGIIRIIGDINRNMYGQLTLTISSTKIRITLTIVIEDENNQLSVARKTNILVNVGTDTENLEKVTRLIPIDNDTAGTYQCRLDSLAVPRGVVLTPDCWLYMTDLLALSNKSNTLTVIHHDGIHRAVKSIFHIDVVGKYFQTRDYGWSLLNLPLFKLATLLPRLRLLKTLLRSLEVADVTIGINPNEHYIIIRANVIDGHILSRILHEHRSRIDTVMDMEGIEIVSDICNVDSCDFHGSCSSVLRTDYNQIFSDDDKLERGAIHVYPLMFVSRTCACQHGYLGAVCNITATCSYQICHNGGICGQDISSQTICECSSGFTGHRCDQDINECNHIDRCGPQGKCVNILGGYKCECNLDWSGSSLCNRPFNHCQSSSCSSPGTIQCIPIVGGFICRCGFGYYGDKCALSAISILAQSYLQWELSYVSTLSLEFATISKNSPLINMELSPSLKIKINIFLGKIRISLTNRNQMFHHRESSIDVSSGAWMKITFSMNDVRVKLVIMECGNLGDCERTNTIYGGTRLSAETIRVAISLRLPLSGVTVILGNDNSNRLNDNSFFVGCIRNMQITNATVISKRETNIYYDSCPRFKHGISPCGNAVDKCGQVGDCVDEWFDGRCTCPEGYQPPSCTPGYSAFSLAPNTIISFVQRSDFVARKRGRQKREAVDVTSEISLKIKTRDVTSIVLLSFSSLHTFTLLQVSNGMINIVDKFAGSSQQLSHKALGVNDNRVHTVTLTRFSSGKLTVTVDSVVAIVEWLQSHDPLGPSVQTIYVGGVPEADRTEELLNIPNYSGCLSEVRFNNNTQPLDGLTERFNVSLVQGNIFSSCSSEVCLKSNICGKYQICQEVFGEPNSHWGQYQCINDERRRILAIVLPVLVCIVLLVSVSTLFICLRMRRRLKRLKAQSEHPSCATRSKYTTSSPSPRDTIDLGNAMGSMKPTRSITSSTLLMQDINRRVGHHPDLIPICGSDQSYYQETSMINPYLSSGQFDSGTSSAKLPKMGYFIQNTPRFLGTSNAGMKGLDDGLVYRCSYNDEYESMGTQPSSNSQGTSNQLTYDDRLPPINPQNKPSQSSSSACVRQFIPRKMDPITGAPIWTDCHKSVDIFSNNEGSFTTSMQVGESNDSLSSRNSEHHVFTPTNSSDSLISNKNGSIPNSSNCWIQIQRALPPPPPPPTQPLLQSEEHYEYADITTVDPIS